MEGEELTDEGMMTEGGAEATEMDPLADQSLDEEQGD